MTSRLLSLISRFKTFPYNYNWAQFNDWETWLSFEQSSKRNNAALYIVSTHKSSDIKSEVFRDFHGLNRILTWDLLQ